MLTLLSAAGGLLGSLLPAILKFMQDKQDKAHELAILDRQAALQKAGADQRLQEIQVQGDVATLTAAITAQAVPSGVKWVDAFNSLVRPLVTYLLLAGYLWIKVYRLYHGEPITTVWNDEDQALLAAALSFWFGQRSIGKAMGRK